MSSDELRTEPSDRRDFASRSISWLKSSVVQTVATHLSIFGIQAIHSVILARILGPEARGEYSTTVMYSQTFLYAGMLGGTFAIARRAGQADCNTSALSNTAVRFGLTTGTICFLIVSLLAWFALPSEKAHLAPLCCVAALLLPLEHARLSLLAVDHGRSEFRRYNSNRLLCASLFPILIVSAWAFGKAQLAVIVTLAVLTPALSLASLIRSHREIRFTHRGEPSVGHLTRESLPYGTGSFAAQMLGRVDSLIVLWLFSFEFQGYYMVALAASNLLRVVPNALSLFSFNHGVNERGETHLRRLISRAFLVLAIQIGSAICFALVLEPLIVFVFRAEFSQAVPLTLALLPGLVIDGVAIVAEGYLRGRGYPLKAVIPRISGTLVILGAAIPLSNSMPTLGIPIAASIGQAVSGLAIIIVAFRICRSKATGSTK